MSAAGTKVLDGDSLRSLCFNCAEAGTLEEAIPVDSAENLYRVHIKAPVVSRTATMHYRPGDGQGFTAAAAICTGDCDDRAGVRVPGRKALGS